MGTCSLIVAWSAIISAESLGCFSGRRMGYGSRNRILPGGIDFFGDWLPLLSLRGDDRGAACRAAADAASVFLDGDERARGTTNAEGVVGPNTSDWGESDRRFGETVSETPGSLRVDESLVPLCVPDNGESFTVKFCTVRIGLYFGLLFEVLLGDFVCWSVSLLFDSICGVLDKSRAGRLGKSRP